VSLIIVMIDLYVFSILKEFDEKKLFKNPELDPSVKLCLMKKLRLLKEMLRNLKNSGQPEINPSLNSEFWPKVGTSGAGFVWLLLLV
jgi:hypothetical protein